MLFGAHISAARGLANAPKNAAAIGCEVFQFFSRPPQGGPASAITPKVVEEFKTACTKYHQQENYIHAPYFINFASSNNRIKYGSVSIIREELERGSLLGSRYLMTHLGSARDLGEKEAIKQTINGLVKVLTGYHGSTELLLENSAGAGKIIGDDFVELGEIIRGIKKQLPTVKLGVCLDTCHAFASGYDWRSKTAITTTLKIFNQIVGLKYLKLWHFNDSEGELNSRRDRHAHLGQGQIGKTAFADLVKYSKLKNINAILETPEGEGRINDLKILKKF